MLRTCPKCSAFYTDESLAFCLADGMPLLSVAPDSERWQEGVRVIEEKTQAARKQRRKLRWRRLAVSGMTTLILAMVVSRSYEVETTTASTIPPVRQSVAALPSYSTAMLPGAWPPEFLLPSESPSPTPSSTDIDPSSPTDTDSSSPTSTSDSANPHTETTTSTTDSSNPTTTDSDSPTSTSDTPPPPPAVFYRISGRVTVGGQPIAGVKVRLEGSKLTTATTDGSGYYAFNDLRAGGSYSVTPLRDKTNFKPFNRSFDNLMQDGSADFNGDGEREREPERDTKPESKCTEADQDRERKIIIDSYSAVWRASVERDRQKIIRENSRDGEEAEATLVPREALFVFVKECKGATVIYKYVWQIRAGTPAAPRNLNVSKQRISACGKMLGRWFCS